MTVNDCSALEQTTSSQPTMSVKRRQRISTLPAEIWLQIFADISYVHEAFTTSDYDAIEASVEPGRSDRLLQSYRAVKNILLSFSAVSSTWHALARPFIFQHAYIHHGKNAASIARALKDLESRMDPEELPGRWIRRIDIAGEVSWTAEESDALVAIVARAHNLKVFADRSINFIEGQATRHATSLTQLARCCTAGSLRRLELQTIPGGSTLQALEIFREIDVLVIMGTHSHDAHVEEPLPLPTVKALIWEQYDDPTSKIPVFEAPALQRLARFGRLSVDHRGLDCISTSLASITSFRFSCEKSWSRSTFVISCLPSLEEVTIDHPYNPTDKYVAFLAHPLLRRINLSYASLLLSSDSFENVKRFHKAYFRDLLEVLLDAKLLPQLEVIGFHIPQSSLAGEYEDARLCRSQVIHEFWDPQLALCSERGVRAEGRIHSHMEPWRIPTWRPFEPSMLLHGDDRHSCELHT